MVLSEKIKSYVMVVKFTRKPQKKEFMLTLKVVLIGCAILGSVGYIFQLLGSALQFRPIGGIPKEYVIISIISIVAVIIGFLLYRYRTAR